MFSVVSIINDLKIKDYKNNWALINSKEQVTGTPLLAFIAL